VKLVASIVLLALAALAGILAWGALQNLFSAYKDSPIATYLLIGLPALAVCIASLYVLTRLWRA
jgi:hypothetical protein